MITPAPPLKFLLSLIQEVHDRQQQEIRERESRERMWRKENERKHRRDQWYFYGYVTFVTGVVVFVTLSILYLVDNPSSLTLIFSEWW